MESSVIIIECIAIGIVFAGLILLLQGDGAKEQKLLILSLSGSLVQNTGYLLELTATNLEAAQTAVTVENVGSAFVPLCYCWFIYLYCFEKVPKRTLRILAIISAFVLPSVIFNFNGLFYQSFEWLGLPDGFHYVSVTYGPLYYVFLFSRILIPYTLCIIALVRSLKDNADKKLTKRHAVILIVSCIPVISLIAYITKLTNIFDFTPASLALTLSLVVIIIWSKRDYSFKYLAAEKVFESLGDGIIVIDEDDRLISSNRAASFIFPDLTPFMRGRNIRTLEGFCEEMLNESKPWTFSVNGQHYECHSKQIKNGAGKKQGYVILVLDMTDMKTYINEIKRVRSQAEEANRAKSEFLANMSHEIRTPMNAIIGLNDIIMEECGDPEIYSYSKNVQSAANNLLAIINDILDLSKIESGKIELIETEYNLKELTDEVVGMMDLQASKKGIVMKYVCDESLPAMYFGDVGRIKQILINIINNAVKFTREGYVKVDVSGTVNDDRTKCLLKFLVEDTGIGIKNEDLGKIFEDFKQVDSKRNRSVEGTGLGLAIVKRLVEMMGGILEVDSVYGIGTTFIITIPQKTVGQATIAESSKQTAHRADKYKSFTAPGFKVLVVDDNAVNRKVAESFLKSYEFDIDQASSGKEAIELVKSKLYDIIFMDHMMPEMDGIEAAQIIRRECGDNGTKPAVIALTANAMEGMREQFLANGFQDFIPKPLNRKQIEALLDKWVPAERRKEADVNKPEQNQLNDLGIKGIDGEAASLYYEGDAAEFNELLKLYLLEGKRKINTLEELSQIDLPAYQTEVHALKSASANIGAVEVSNMARAQENAAAQKETEFIKRQLPALVDKYGELLKNIEAYLDSQKSEEKSDGTKEEISEEQISIKIKDALEHIENFRSEECAQAVDELLRFSLPKDVADKLKAVKEQLELFEDENAETMLKELYDLTARQ